MCDYCDCRELGPIGELSEEHEEIAALAFRLRQQITGGAEEMETTLGELRGVLEPHLAREERGILLQLAARGDFDRYIGELLDDHARVTAALLVADPSGQEWALGALQALDELRAHIDVEEHDLFPCSRLVIDDAGWERVALAHREIDRAWHEEHVLLVGQEHKGGSMGTKIDREVATGTLAELVRARPQLAGVLERFGLDYCCHGDQTLAQACSSAETAIETVQAALDEASSALEEHPSWTELDPCALAEHIIATHHRYLRAELPLLVELGAKVAAAHGERHGELAELRRLVGELEADLLPHLDKEELVLFPAIRTVTTQPLLRTPSGIERPIAVMTAEHEATGELLRHVRELTGGYAVPEDACPSYRSLLERLEALEADTHLHIFKENSVLFPAAVAPGAPMQDNSQVAPR